MRIAVVSMDTRGGIQPYIALARGLAQAGHELRMIAPADFEGSIRAWGVDVRPLSGSVEAVLRGSTGATEKGALASMRFAKQQLDRTIVQWTREALDGCQGVDVITGGIGGLVVAEGVSEKLGVPFIETHLQPVGQRTREFAGALFGSTPAWAGDWGRRVSHALTEFGVWAPFRGAMQRARVEALGREKRSRVDRSALPVLYGISPRVVPPPSDWDARRRFVGYWTLPPADDWRPAPELEAFLARGPAPVCVGFGSMTSDDPRATTELVLEAVRRAGVRAVLLSGWGALQDVRREDVFVAESVPHEWLFPRMSAVVHHGGAGTTAAGFRSGVPAIVVPFTMDQPFWASRVAALGAGPAPIPRKRLTVQALADALRVATNDRAMRERAATLGALIREEDGVREAVEHFDRWDRARVKR